MHNFVQMTKLSNVVGRADYISNCERQENIVIQSEPIDWKPYQLHENAHKKSNVDNNEARELIIALPNEWGKLDRSALKKRVQDLAELAIEKNTDMQWAVHWNKSKSNLHVHVIFSERTADISPLPSKKKNQVLWDRDIYLTAEGKVARNKADRAVDENGNVKPPVHRKGELKDNVDFTAKDTRYKSKRWLNETKKEIVKFYEKHGVNIEKQNFLTEFKEGKGDSSIKAHHMNAAIREINKHLPSKLGVILPGEDFSSFKRELKRGILAGKYPININMRDRKVNAWIPIQEFYPHKQHVQEWVKHQFHIRKKKKPSALDVSTELAASKQKNVADNTQDTQQQQTFKKR